MSADYARARELQRIWSVAQGLGGDTRLPRVIVMTDPRAPEPNLSLWPGPVALVYRHFGAADRLERAQGWRQATLSGGHTFLVGEDPELAVAVGADGVHFRRDATLAGPRLWRRRCPDWLITMAGWKTGDYTAPLDSLDGLLVSSVFASTSPSAGVPIGPDGLEVATRLPVPVYALGGIHAGNVERLRALPIAGIAGVSFQRRAIVDELNIEKQERGKDIRLAATHPDFPGLEAELDLKWSGDGQYSATHTGVPREMEGKGVGSKLFAAMVEDARAEGYKVIPVCPFIVAKYKRKPETRDTMVAP